MIQLDTSKNLDTMYEVRDDALTKTLELCEEAISKTAHVLRENINDVINEEDAFSDNTIMGKMKMFANWIIGILKSMTDERTSFSISTIGKIKQSIERIKEWFTASVQYVDGSIRNVMPHVQQTCRWICDNTYVSISVIEFALNVDPTVSSRLIHYANTTILRFVYICGFLDDATRLAPEKRTQAIRNLRLQQMGIKDNQKIINDTDMQQHEVKSIFDSIDRTSANLNNVIKAIKIYAAT